jgi:hypothetical protein
MSQSKTNILVDAIQALSKNEFIVISVKQAMKLLKALGDKCVCADTSALPRAFKYVKDGLYMLAIKKTHQQFELCLTCHHHPCGGAMCNNRNSACINSNSLSSFVSRHKLLASSRIIDTTPMFDGDITDEEEEEDEEENDEHRDESENDVEDGDDDDDDDDENYDGDEDDRDVRGDDEGDDEDDDEDDKYDIVMKKLASHELHIKGLEQKIIRYEADMNFLHRELLNVRNAIRTSDAPAASKPVYTVSKKPGTCMTEGCDKAGSYISLKHLATGIKFKGKLDDPRKYTVKQAYTALRMCGMYCTSCYKGHEGYTICISNVHNYCTICRTSRAGNGNHNVMCSVCQGDADKMLHDHSIRDSLNLFQKAVIVLKTTSQTIADIRVTQEYNPWLANTKNDAKCRIDSLVEVDFWVTERKKSTFMFMVEFQNTKNERAPSVVLHKFGRSIQNIKPDKAFLWCVNIGNINQVGYNEYTLAQRMDILRRYIMVCIVHHSVFYKYNHWWFFQGNNIPIAPSQVRDNKRSFIYAQVQIHDPPATATDMWTYSTDPMADMIPGKQGNASIKRKLVKSQLPKPKKRVVIDDVESQTESDNATTDNEGEEMPSREERRRTNAFRYTMMQDLKALFGLSWPEAINAYVDYTKLPEIDMYCKPECPECATCFEHQK